MSVDRDVVVRLLRQYEADVHRAGWNRPWRILVVYTWRDDDTEHQYRAVFGQYGVVRRLGGYAVRAVSPVQEGPASHGVFAWATSMRYAAQDPRTRVVVDALRAPGFVGVGLVDEQWLVEGRAGQPRPQGSLADHPQRIEARCVYLVDRFGGDYWIQRRRHEPVRDMVDAGYRLSGAIPESLRTITAAVAGEPLPPIDGTVPHGWRW